jgi:hypothetical protein
LQKPLLRTLLFLTGSGLQEQILWHFLVQYLEKKNDWVFLSGTPLNCMKEKLFSVLAETTAEYIFSRGKISEGSQLLGTSIGLHAGYRRMQTL